MSADACDLREIPDHAFNIAHSNSVIEHVGDWERMHAFAKELIRVAPRSYVQTPNFWFPIEPHCMTPFFHWLPYPARVALVQRIGLGHWQKASTVDQAIRLVNCAHLLNRSMFSTLFPDAKILTERFCLLPKSLIALR